MKRKIILIVLIFLLNMVWVNAITVTNNFETAKKSHFLEYGKQLLS